MRCGVGIDPRNAAAVGLGDVVVRVRAVGVADLCLCPGLPQLEHMTLSDFVCLFLLYLAHIIEQVDKANKNASTLHTNPTVTLEPLRGNSLERKEPPIATLRRILGAAFIATRTTHSGAAFSGNVFGLYAMEWTQQHIATWMSNEGATPRNAMSTSPDPSQWGITYAQLVFWRLVSEAAPSSHFTTKSIVFDLTFCGDRDGAKLARIVPVTDREVNRRPSRTRFGAFIL